jgi:hypothetical protein
MPVIKPSKSDLNLTPSSTELESDSDGFAGVVELLQPLHGQLGPAAVVKDQVKSATSALPERSLIRGSVLPPFKVAVYVVEGDSVAAGSSIAVLVAASYMTVEETTVFPGSRNSKVAVVSVVASIASLKVAVTVVP